MIANHDDPEITQSLKERFEAVSSQIRNCEVDRNSKEITEKTIDDYLRWARVLMEHPEEIMTDCTNLPKTNQLLKVVFQEPPTYEELLDGTPKLKPLFALKSTFTSLEISSCSEVGDRTQDLRFMNPPL